MNKFYFLFLAVLFSSCFTRHRLDYLGNSYAPTQKIDVYVDVSAIKKSYTIIGKSYFEQTAFTSLESMQRKAVETAKHRGADAVLFQDYYIKEDGASINMVTKTDSIGKGLLTVQTGRVAPIVSSRTDILFLKYD